MAAVEWKWTESPGGAGSVLIESTCWSLGSLLKGFVQFWLGAPFDTSYINFRRSVQKSNQGFVRDDLWVEHNDSSFCFPSPCVQFHRLYSGHLCYMLEWLLLRKQQRGKQTQGQHLRSMNYFFFFSVTLNTTGTNFILNQFLSDARVKLFNTWWEWDVIWF